MFNAAQMARLRAALARGGQPIPPADPLTPVDRIPPPPSFPNSPVAPVTVVVPAFHNHNGLLNLLDSLAIGTVHPIEVIIIDNGCDWNSDITGYPFGVRMIRPGRNMGVAAAWNLGRRESKTDDVLITNDDILFGPPALEKAIEPPPSVGMVFLHGYACFLWRKWFAEALGDFDEGFYPAYYEDTDMTERFENSGLPKESRREVYGHTTHYSTGRGLLDWVKDGYERNKQRFVAKWGYDASVGHDPSRGFKTPWNLPTASESNEFRAD